jgi:hypothetical protein
MKSTAPTTKIAPSTYNALDSFKKAVEVTRTFSLKARRDGHIEAAIKKSKQTPGAGHYGIDQINKGFNITTRGASRGWK